MTLTMILNWLLPLLTLQAVAGVIAVVRMWGVQIAQQAEMKELRNDIVALAEGDKVAAANMTGLTSQLASINAGVGEVKGQLSILVSDRHNTHG